MKAVAEAVFKEKQFVEGYEKLINKKVQQIEPHYNIIIDEVSDGRINQQTLWAKADNEELIKKLERLDMYQRVKFFVNVNFYEGKPSKITVLDLLDDVEPLAVVTEIFNKQEEKLKAEKLKRQEQE